MKNDKAVCYIVLWFGQSSPSIVPAKMSRVFCNYRSAVKYAQGQEKEYNCLTHRILRVTRFDYLEIKARGEVQS